MFNPTKSRKIKCSFDQMHIWHAHNDNLEFPIKREQLWEGSWLWGGDYNWEVWDITGYVMPSKQSGDIQSSHPRDWKLGLTRICWSIHFPGCSIHLNEKCKDRIPIRECDICIEPEIHCISTELTGGCLAAAEHLSSESWVGWAWAWAWARARARARARVRAR